MSDSKRVRWIAALMLSGAPLLSGCACGEGPPVRWACGGVTTIAHAHAPAPVCDARVVAAEPRWE